MLAARIYFYLLFSVKKNEYLRTSFVAYKISTKYIVHVKFIGSVCKNKTTLFQWHL